MRRLYLWVWVVLSLPALGAELSFNFEDSTINEQPPGFTNVLYGKGKHGDWRIIMDEVPPLIAPATPQAPAVTKRAVLAQLSRNPTDERFPLLLYDKETFGDFTLTTRLKIVYGVMEQLAGIVFRVQDETNFYVIRANAMDNTVRFYKVVNGIRGPMLGSKLEIPRGVWHELKIDCKGNQIRAWLDDKEAIAQVSDSTFSAGKIGFWTKSDAISYFADTRITYTPRESLAHLLVRGMVEKYPRLRELKISTLGENGEPRVEASKDAKEIGAAGNKSEKATITKGSIFVGKGKDTVTVVMPLRDRDGEPIAAVTITMDSFTGQTEQNAIVRALPMVKEMQKQAQSLRELTE